MHACITHSPLGVVGFDGKNSFTGPFQPFALQFHLDSIADTMPRRSSADDRLCKHKKRKRKGISQQDERSVGNDSDQSSHSHRDTMFWGESTSEELTMCMQEELKGPNDVKEDNLAGKEVNTLFSTVAAMQQHWLNLSTDQKETFHENTYGKAYRWVIRTRMVLDEGVVRARDRCPMAAVSFMKDEQNDPKAAYVDLAYDDYAPDRDSASYLGSEAHYVDRWVGSCASWEEIESMKMNQLGDGVRLYCQYRETTWKNVRQNGAGE